MKRLITGLMFVSLLAFSCAGPALPPPAGQSAAPGAPPMTGREPAPPSSIPMPSDAREITFTITQINDSQGPWVFKMPLQ